MRGQEQERDEETGRTILAVRSGGKRKVERDARERSGESEGGNGSGVSWGLWGRDAVREINQSTDSAPQKAP